MSPLPQAITHASGSGYALARLDLVVGPGGAVGLGALLAGRVPGTRSCVVVLSGENVDRRRIEELTE